MTETENPTRDRSRADATLLAALASGATLRQAADAAGVSESTVSRRLRDPDFRLELEARQEQALDEAMSRLGALATQALDVLARAMQPGTDHTLQLRAATAVLGSALKIRDRKLVEIEQRLHWLERPWRSEGKSS